VTPHHQDPRPIPRLPGYRGYRMRPARHFRSHLAFDCAVRTIEDGAGQERSTPVGQRGILLSGNGHVLLDHPYRGGYVRCRWRNASRTVPFPPRGASPAPPHPGGRPAGTGRRESRSEAPQRSFPKGAAVQAGQGLHTHRRPPRSGHHSQPTVNTRASAVGSRASRTPDGRRDDRDEGASRHVGVMPQCMLTAITRNRCPGDRSERVARPPGSCVSATLTAITRCGSSATTPAPSPAGLVERHVGPTSPDESAIRSTWCRKLRLSRRAEIAARLDLAWKRARRDRGGPETRGGPSWVAPPS
jgi:hypothetical protein